jgi:hypothetical protein
MQNNFLSGCARSTYSQDNCSTLQARITEPDVTPLSRQLSAPKNRGNRNLTLEQLRNIPRELYVDVNNRKVDSTRDVPEFGNRLTTSDDARRMNKVADEQLKRQEQINQYRFRIPDHLKAPQLNTRGSTPDSFPVFLDDSPVPEFDVVQQRIFDRNVRQNPTKQMNIQKFTPKNSWMIMDPKKTNRMTSKDISVDLPPLTHF